jgi:hypothetical protein
VLALAAVAAVGFASLTTRLSPRNRIIALMVVSGLILGESAFALSLVRVPNAHAATAVNDALAKLPAGPVAELPVGSPTDGAAWAYIETPRQWLSRIDGHPRVGGYSGFDPKGYDELAATLETFPAPDALARLHDLGVRYVVLRTALPGPLPGFQAAIVDVDGVGKYTPEHARQIVDAIPPGAAKRVEHDGAAWLIQLR